MHSGARGPNERTPSPIHHRACACPGRSRRPASAGPRHSRALLALALALALALTAALPLLAQPAPAGPPFVLSAPALAALGQPRLSAAPSGEAVALWVGECPVLAVCARTWDAAGTPVAGPFALPIDLAELDAVPALAAAPGGGFWVAWSRPTDALARRVVVRRFTAGGAAVTAERVVAAAAAQIFTAPDLAADAAGAPLVVWERRRFEGEVGGQPVTVGVEIQGRRLDPAGIPLGAAFRVDEDDDDLVSAPAAAVAADGSFLVAWESFGFAGGEEDVVARAFVPGGDGSAAPVDGQSIVHPSAAGSQVSPAAASADGVFLVAWEDADPAGSSVFARLFDGAGEPLGPAPFPLGGPGGAQRRPAAAGGDGAFVLAWEETAGGALFAQRRDLLGLAIEPAFRIDTGGGTALVPAVAALPGEGAAGGLLAAWSEERPDFSRRLLARRYPGTVPPPEPCAADDHTLCLGPGGRFRVTASWTTAAGDSGPGTIRPLTADTGTFWFFDAANLELVVKTLAACPVNGHHWVFAAGLTDVAVTLVVEDTLTGRRRTYQNPQQTPFQPVQDTAAFPCP